jgi:DNA-directed RNA polymerase specialized sigma24 family protein
VLTSLKSWVRPDSFHAVLSERSVRWYNACLRITRDPDLAADAVQEAIL